MGQILGRVGLRGVAGAAPTVAFALCGCLSFPAPSAPALTSADAALRARATVTTEAPTLSETPAPAQWWSLFGDDVLTGLEAQAAEANLDIQAAAVRLDESRAQLGLAAAARQPRVDVEADYARSAISKNSPLARLGAYTGDADLWSLGLQASWEPDFWGRLRQRSVAAEARVSAAGYGVAAAHVSVAGDVARAYLLLRGVQAQEVILEQNRSIAADLVRLAESRERNGVGSRVDVAAARADLAGIEAAREPLRHQRDGLMNALALLLGQAPRELDARLAPAGLPPTPERLPIGVASDLARNRPDILAAEARLRAAVADIGAARADFYPGVRLTGGVGLQALDLSDLGSWDSRQFSVGPSLYLPIFEGGRLRSQLRLTQARQRLTAIDYQQTVLGAWREVDDALGAYAGELRRRERLEIAETQNQTALDAAQRAYQQGVANFTTVLIARRSLLASQSELNDCATASALTVVALYRALGGGWSPDLRAGGAEAPRT